MIESLITSKTRVKLLLKFFLNTSTKSYLRGLESEFGESTNGIRLELNRFEQAGLLISHNESNRKVFSANTSHPLFPEIQNLLLKHTGIDQLTEQIIGKLGDVEKVYLTGGYARGQESPAIEILLVGGNVDVAYLESLIAKAIQLIKKQILYRRMTTGQFDLHLAKVGNENLLLLWQQCN